VVAVPHDEWGSAIVAWVVPKEGEAVTPTSVKKHLVERIPRYMLPARVEVLEGGNLPRTSNGKIDRQRLGEDAQNLSAV
jgi:acyl-CoA synthetase (AMP-forming)/AMP-acid ligase II